MLKLLTKIFRREPDYSPEFRERLNMVVARARAESLGNGRHVIAYGPKGPLFPGAATVLARLPKPTEVESA